MRVGHVWKTERDGCVGQEDKMALGPPGQGRVGGPVRRPQELLQELGEVLRDEEEFSWDQKPLLLKTLFFFLNFGFIYSFIYLFIYLWLCWVFVSV